MTETAMRYLLALDHGTTGSLVLLFEEHAALVGMAQEEHPQRRSVTRAL